MKHTWRITVILAVFFLLAQIIGLLIISQYIDHNASSEAKETVMKPLPYGFERPQIENKSASFIYIVVAIIFGTLLVLLLARFNKPLIWKIWFFLTIWFTLSVALAAFINNIAAAILALALAILKFYKPNVIVQNLSEIFVYGGLAAFFVNIFNLFAIVMLLIVISIYDYISVFKTMHMVKLAEFQYNSKVFAGLFIPYERTSSKEKIIFNADLKKDFKKMSKAKSDYSEKSVAVLGGGDIGFTLLFAGVVMKDLMLVNDVWIGFLKTLIIPVFATIALLFLLVKGRQNKFYPAMPILSLGCFIGYSIVWLI